MPNPRTTSNVVADETASRAMAASHAAALILRKRATAFGERSGAARDFCRTPASDSAVRGRVLEIDIDAIDGDADKANEGKKR